MVDVDDESDSESEKESGGGGLRPELIQSYLAFAKRALRIRWGWSVLVFAVGLGLTIAANKYLPRTYSCTTVMMAQGTGVLDTRSAADALAGAEDIITRHENLEALIRDTGLAKTSIERSPPLIRLKERISTALLGAPSEKIRTAILVGTLETKIVVSVEKGDLSIKASWTDPRTAAELAQAARESFLKARHYAEISAFEEKMAILDSHAGKLRDDIGALVEELKVSRNEQLARERRARSEARKSAAATKGTDSLLVPRELTRRGPEPDAEIPVLREKLSELKNKLASQDSDRERRVREEQAKYDDLKLRLTSSHPAVVTQAERIAIASQVPSSVALMQAEIKNLEGEIRQREAMARQGGDFLGGGGGSRRADKESETLPEEVSDLLGRENLDPALSSQLSGAVAQYGALRRDLFSTRVDLDTAQAAFTHRYQVIIPAEPPTKAEKPKPAVVIGGGLFLSLLLSLLFPIVAELRTGVIRDRWQAEHIQLPVLAELRLPPHSPD